MRICRFRRKYIVIVLASRGVCCKQRFMTIRGRLLRSLPDRSVNTLTFRVVRNLITALFSTLATCAWDGRKARRSAWRNTLVGGSLFTTLALACRSRCSATPIRLAIGLMGRSLIRSCKRRRSVHRLTPWSRGCPIMAIRVVPSSGTFALGSTLLPLLTARTISRSIGPLAGRHLQRRTLSAPLRPMAVIRQLCTHVFGALAIGALIRRITRVCLPVSSWCRDDLWLRDRHIWMRWYRPVNTPWTSLDCPLNRLRPFAIISVSTLIHRSW